MGTPGVVEWGEEGWGGHEYSMDKDSTYTSSLVMVPDT